VVALVFFSFPSYSYFLTAPQAKIQEWFPRFANIWLAIRDCFIESLLVLLTTALLIFPCIYMKEMILVARRRRNELILSFTVALISLLAMEIILRRQGYKPGQISGYHYIEVVDTLINYDGYLADEHGMTYTDPRVADKLHRFLQARSAEKYTSVNAADYPEWSHVAYDIQQLIVDYPPVIAGVDTGEFSGYYKAIRNKTTLNDFDSLVLNYVVSPVNSEGFRSISFRSHSARKRILLIGDSYTFGYSASNRLKSFYDLLLARGYEVYNTGIIGADPPQYLSVAAKYVPLLKPDIVIVNFYLGNDIQYYRQNFDPYQPYFYRTNAGAILSCPLGVKMHSAREAYEIALDGVVIPTDNSAFNRLCGHSVITTLLWNALKDILHLQKQSASVKDFYERAESFKIDHPDGNDRIPIIEKLCRENGSKFILCIIPNLPGDGGRKLRHKADYPLLFPEQKYFEPDQLQETDYCSGGDTHFNDAGHRKYATFLQSIIDTSR